MNDIVKEMRGSYEKGFDFLFRQIDECTDEVWNAATGNFHYWQHIYHAFACVDFFILPPGGGIDAGPYSFEVVMFREAPENAPSREVIREYGKRKKAAADAWIDGLKDADLPLRHEGFSSRKNADLSNATVLSNLATHNYYHFGCNDSILREHGFPGLY